MAVVTMRQMLEAGVHFGHQTGRWNRRCSVSSSASATASTSSISSRRCTASSRAYGFVRDLVANGGMIMFVGTKKQAQDPVRSYAEKCGMPYVNERWLGGMLTNFETISKRVAKMLEYERMQAAGEFEAMPKKDSLLSPASWRSCSATSAVSVGTGQRPDALFVHVHQEGVIAVREAHKLGIPSSRSSTPTSTPSSCSTHCPATTTPSAPTRCWPG